MITIFDPRVLQLPMPFDAKMCNYHLDTDGYHFKIETIAEYLTRVDLYNRSMGVIIAMAIPKEGYSAGSFPIDEIETFSTHFDNRWYSFIGGIEDTNFIEILPPLRQFTALVSQTSTNNPSLKVLENLIGNITVSRVSQGTYNFTSAGLFTADKFVPVDDCMVDQLGNYYTLNRIDENTVQLKTFASGDFNTSVDGILVDRYINFRLFN